MCNMFKSGFIKFQYKHFSDSQEKSEKPSLFVVAFMNDKIQNFEGVSIFPERPIDFHDF